MSQLRPERAATSAPDRRYTALAVLLYATGLLLARPWAGIAMVDDWSYIKSAEVLAHTGHIVYNGWATAMMGWQLYAGALVVKLFGDSFTGPRIAVMVVGALCVALAHRIFLRFGASPRSAFLPTLVLALSPMFVQLSATFMSDVPGLFAILLCLYLCLRAREASSDAAACVWLSTAALSNAVLGSCRQVAWLGVITLVPATLWLLRRRRLLAVNIAATLAGLVIVWLTMHWYGTKPYALSDTRNFHFRAWGLSRILDQQIQCFLLMWLLGLPLLLAFVERRRARLLAVVFAFAVALQAWFFFLTRHSDHTFFLSAPFVPNWLTVFGHFTTEAPLLPSPPVILTRPILVVLNAVFDTALVAAALAAFDRLRRPADAADVHAALPWREVAVLLVPFLLAYFALLTPRAADSLTDRYVVPLGFVACLLLVRLHRDLNPARWPAATIAATIVIALYSVAATHDFFAAYRAKARLFADIEHSGVRDTQIEAGWDIDGWTELQHAAYLNDPRIRIPASAYQPKRPLIPNPCMFRIYQDLTPHMEPLYAIRYSPDTAGGPAPFPAVGYTQWLRFGRTTTLYAVRCDRGPLPPF